jgi:hypothetical protein
LGVSFFPFAQNTAADYYPRRSLLPRDDCYPGIGAHAMNAVALLLAASSLAAGVEYDWRTTADGQQEYLLLVSPDVLPLLLTIPPPGALPEEIQSALPAEVTAVQRLCIRIGSQAPAHSPAGEQQFRQLLVSAGRYASADQAVTAGESPVIFWPARGNPEQSLAVRTGWQPDAGGAVQYLVQIDRALLGTLAIGDEIYVPVDPAVGRPSKFVVKSGSERDLLPRSGPPSSGAPSSQYSQWTPPPQSGAGHGGRIPFTRTSERAPGPPQPRGYGNDYPATPYGQPETSPAGASQPPFFDPRTAQQPPNYYVPPAGQMADARASQPPRFGQPQSTYSPPLPDGRQMALPTTAVTALPGAWPTNLPNGQQDRPWGPLLFVTFALFFSIGGNLYLAYTALEFHTRYRSAIERLRSAARSA